MLLHDIYCNYLKYVACYLDNKSTFSSNLSNDKEQVLSIYVYPF